MDQSVLEELGLSNAESKIYLALLKGGLSKTGKIITDSKLQSSTVYHVIDSLVDKGLVNFIFKGKIKYYQAENPKMFLNFLEEKRRKFLEILPELKEIKHFSGKKSAARVYQGIKGLQAAYSDILSTMKEGEEYYFTQIEKTRLEQKEINLFFRNYHLKRSAKGIKVRSLAPPNCKKIMKKLFEGIELTKIRFNTNLFPKGLVVYKNKIITLDMEDVITAIVIESDSIAASYKQFLDEKWEEGEE